MSARTDIVTILKAQLPATWRVIPNDAQPVITDPTVIVYTEQVVPGPAQGVRATTVAVWVLTPKQTGGTADAETMLDITLTVLDDLPNLHWSTADYQVYAESFPGYKITTTLYTPRS